MGLLVYNWPHRRYPYISLIPSLNMKLIPYSGREICTCRPIGYTINPHRQHCMQALLDVGTMMEVGIGATWRLRSNDPCCATMRATSSCSNLSHSYRPNANNLAEYRDFNMVYSRLYECKRAIIILYRVVIS